MANIGDIKLTILGRIEGNEPVELGYINIPLSAGQVYRTQSGTFTANIKLDQAELARRLHDFTVEAQEAIHTSLTELDDTASD